MTRALEVGCGVSGFDGSAEVKRQRLVHLLGFSVEEHFSRARTSVAGPAAPPSAPILAGTPAYAVSARDASAIMRSLAVPLPPLPSLSAEVDAIATEGLSRSLKMCD